jgi:hypothetical protein
MSGLGEIAALENVTKRQVRRWCKEGRVPARRRKGRWHVDQQWLRQARNREANGKKFFDVYGRGERNKRILAATVLANDIWDPKKLLPHFPDKFRFLYFDYKPHPEAYRVADDPKAFLRVRIGLFVRRNGIPSVKELAEALGVSKSQLFRAEPGLIKKLKRRHLHDPGASVLPARLKGRRNHSVS